MPKPYSNDSWPRPDGGIHRGRLATAQNATAGALHRLGRLDLALDKLRQSLDQALQFTAEEPKDSTVHGLVANLHKELGTVLRETGKTAEAEIEHRQGLTSQAKAAAAQSPKNAGLQAQHNDNCTTLAQCLTMLGKGPEAVALTREAVAIYK